MTCTTPTQQIKDQEDITVAKLRALSNIAHEAQHIEAGTIFECDTDNAKLLTSIGRAVPVSDEEAAAIAKAEAEAAKGGKGK